MSSRDLDKGGFGFQKVRTYLGPSLGWKEELVQQTTPVKTIGTYVVQPGDSILLVDAPGQVQIQLPDVRLWIQQTANQPATGFERNIIVKDIGGNAANFNIAIIPFGQQNIDNIAQAVLMTQSRSIFELIPLIDLTGWAIKSATVTGGGGGGGGGDVFKAGNNTYTGVNSFLNTTTGVTPLPSDNSVNFATTEWIVAKNYLTSVSLTGYATIFSPTFTGDPRAPTPSAGDNDDTIATTKFVHDVVSALPGGAPAAADYVIGTVNPSLPAGRIPTNSATINWDLTVPGQIKANTSAGGGNVSNSGTPTVNQLAQWVTSSTIRGIDVTSLNLQPLDDDLTAISALAGTNTIYYRSAPGIWSPVTYSGLTFSGGVLGVTGGGGNVSNAGTPVAGQMAQWTTATTIQGVTAPPAYTAAATAPGTPKAGDLWYDLSTGILAIFINDGNSSQWVQIGIPSTSGFAPLASPTFTGDPKAPTQAPSDADTSIATTAFVRTGVTDGSNAAAGQVGQYMSNTSSAVAIPGSSYQTLTNLTLTAGDWDVQAFATFSSGTPNTRGFVSVTTGAILDTTPNRISMGLVSSGGDCYINLASTRISIAASTTYNAVVLSDNAITAQAMISARRVR